MRLVTMRTPTGTRAARIDGDDLVALPYPSLVELLAEPDWRQRASSDGPRTPAATATLDALVRPARTVCVGQNYRAHIAELGNTVPDFPTLFNKFPDALIGPTDAIVLPPESTKVDWEVELGVVIGSPTRRVSTDVALDHVAGFTIVNDTSMRDHQYRTQQWLQGKTWPNATPVGPCLVTLDEFADPTALRLWTEVDGTRMQDGNTSDMVFDVPTLIAYISTCVQLQPGDLIATGTPSGVGAGRTPPVFLHGGQTVRCGIDGIGELANPTVAEQLS
ncbi:MAG: fumarylacetoacetate hydrolase family protein [Acidimicrobiia bacterium]